MPCKEALNRALLQALGSRHPGRVAAVLPALALLRPQLEGEVDAVVGKAVTVLGPRPVLTVLPLGITGEETGTPSCQLYPGKDVKRQILVIKQSLWIAELCSAIA